MRYRFEWATRARAGGPTRTCSTAVSGLKRAAVGALPGRDRLARRGGHHQPHDQALQALAQDQHTQQRSHSGSQAGHDAQGLVRQEFQDHHFEPDGRVIGRRDSGHHVSSNSAAEQPTRWAVVRSEPTCGHSGVANEVPIPRATNGPNTASMGTVCAPEVRVSGGAR